jgi:hypothetical protein
VPSPARKGSSQASRIIRCYGGNRKARSFRCAQRRGSRNPYIVFNDLPKIENLKRLFPTLYRAEPVLVATAGLSDCCRQKSVCGLPTRIPCTSVKKLPLLLMAWPERPRDHCGPASRAGGEHPNRTSPLIA